MTTSNVIIANMSSYTGGTLGFVNQPGRAFGQSFEVSGNVSLENFTISLTTGGFPDPTNIQFRVKIIKGSLGSSRSEIFNNVINFNDPSVTMIPGQALTFAVPLPSIELIGNGTYSIEFDPQDAIGSSFGVTVTSPQNTYTDGTAYLIGETGATAPTPLDYDLILSLGYQTTSGSISQGTANITPICFLSGSLISTTNGHIPIENLRIGDVLLVHSQKTSIVKWIGRQTIHPMTANLNDVMPIRISAGALGENVPRANLFISPNHAMFIEGHLIHARALINGRSIVQMTNWDGDIKYFHIETEDHEIIYAEGAPAESYIDNVLREQFDNFSEYETLYPDAPMMRELDYPRIKFSRQLPNQIVAHLEQRAEILAGERALMHA